MTPRNDLLQAEEVKVCVLYEPSTGRVVHVHRVTTMPGGRRLDQAAMEKRIRELAKLHGADSPALRVFHVDPKDIVVGANYMVDVDAKKLRRISEKSSGTSRVRALSHRP